MAGNIIGEPIDEKILEQIDLRQKMHGAGYNSSSISRDPKILNYLNNRNAWIKMASGVSIDGEEGLKKLKDFSLSTNNYLSENDLKDLTGIGLAKRSVLFNTIQSSNRTEDSKNAGYISRSGVRKDNFFKNSTNKMYGGLGSNSRGLQPVGGITDITVKSLNRGSIKKATVNIKVYNKFQFSIIEILYLRLGYIMMLEWGWDKYVDTIDTSSTPPKIDIKDTQSTIIENSWFDGKSYTQRLMLNKINYYNKKYKGNYGGFFGKVSNFNWKLNQDGSYDITIDLVTLGSVIESLKANISAQNLTEEEIKNIQVNLAKKFDVEANKETGKYDNPIIDNLGNNTITQWVSTTISDFPFKNKNYLYFPNLAGEPYSPTNPLRKKIPPTSQYYVRFGTFLNKLQTLIIGAYKNGNVEGKILEIDTSENNTICNYVTNLIPLENNKCVFSIIFDENIQKQSYLDLNSFNKILKPFAFQEGDTNVVYGKLMNVYLNLEFINSSLESNIDNEGNVSVYNFLESLCKGINDSTGNTTNIEPSIKNNKTIYFLEKNPIKGYDSTNKKEEKKEYPLEIMGYNSNGSSNFVKDFSFQTKITPDLMAMISIGASAEGTKDIDAIPFKKWNKGLKNRFEESYTNSPTIIDPPTDTQIAAEKIRNAFISDLKNNSDNIDYDSWFTTNNYDWTYQNKTYYDITPPGKELEGPEKDINNEALLDEVVKRVQEYQDEIKAKEAASGRKIIPLGTKIENVLFSYSDYIIQSFGGDTGRSRIFTSGNLFSQVIASRFGKWWLSSDNQDFIKKGISTWKSYIREINLIDFQENNVNSSLSGFIPVELSITMEGISGVKIYNKIQINQKFLPSSYPEALKFIIKGVDHKISNNVWETNISTISTSPTDNAPTNTPTTVNQPSNNNQPIEVKGPIPPKNPNDTLVIEDNRTVAGKPFDSKTYGKKQSVEWLIGEMNIHTQNKWRGFFSELKAQYPGYTLKINATYRTYQRSIELKKENPKNATPGYSPHNYAYGIDMNIVDPNGNTFIKANRTPWIESGIADLAQKTGIRWGGNFSSYVDCIHFDATPVTIASRQNAREANEGLPQKDWDTKNINYV